MTKVHFVAETTIALVLAVTISAIVITVLYGAHQERADGEAFMAVVRSAGLCCQASAGRELHIQAILSIFRGLEAGLCIRRSATPDHHQSQRRASVSNSSRISAMPLRRKRCHS